MGILTISRFSYHGNHQQFNYCYDYYYCIHLNHHHSCRLGIISFQYIYCYLRATITSAPMVCTQIFWVLVHKFPRRRLMSLFSTYAFWHTSFSPLFQRVRMLRYGVRSDKEVAFSRLPPSCQYCAGGRRWHNNRSITLLVTT